MKKVSNVSLMYQHIHLMYDSCRWIWCLKARFPIVGRVNIVLEFQVGEATIEDLTDIEIISFKFNFTIIQRPSGLYSPQERCTFGL